MVNEYTIDAAGKTLGRVASEAAKALMGKMSPTYTPHSRSHIKVCVVNASKISVREKKRARKIYKTYSGHPSGQRLESYKQLSARCGEGEPLRRAVARMLPRNTFHKARMKSLVISP